MKTPAPFDHDRKPLLVTCRACRHVWAAVWTPCDMRLLSAVNPRLCPWCGCRKRGNIFLAAAKDGDLMRYATWLRNELVRAEAAAFPAALSEPEPQGETR